MAIDTFFCISRFLIIPSRVSFKDAFLVVGGGGGGGSVVRKACQVCHCTIHRLHPHKVNEHSISINGQ